MGVFPSLVEAPERSARYAKPLRTAGTATSPVRINQLTICVSATCVSATRGGSIASDVRPVVATRNRYVRALPALAVTIERTITRSGKAFRTGHHAWEQAESPAIYRTATRAITGPLLELAQGEAPFGVDRPRHRHPRTAHRADPVRHRRPAPTASRSTGHRAGTDLRHPHHRRTQAHLARDHQRPACRCLTSAAPWTSRTRPRSSTPPASHSAPPQPDHPGSCPGEKGWSGIASSVIARESAERPQYFCRPPG